MDVSSSDQLTSIQFLGVVLTVVEALRGAVQKESKLHITDYHLRHPSLQDSPKKEN